MIGTLKKIIQKMLGRCGYQLIWLPSQTPDDKRAHEDIRPAATYAPWNTDAAFVTVFNAIKDNTLVDIYRCWELWTLVEQSAKLEGNILEIGVWRGGTGTLMAQKAKLCGIDDTVYLCDTFCGVVKAGGQDTGYEGGEHSDTSREKVEYLVRDVMKLSNVTILQGIFPDETAGTLESRDARFRLCHIDVDVYQSAKDVLEWVWDRLVIGGIVVFDDYGFASCKGITQFVNEQAVKSDLLAFHNLNGHAVLIKLAASHNNDSQVPLSEAALSA